ncbi:MAG: glycoside hydrolase family 65 protein [Desulfohalobiaceae bacterium]|nr:glycoside hydrolase family 65 protein [Desulfohalobiaceae bacterium]
MDDWILRYQGFDEGQEGLREALCTLGNGYFATRGASPQSRADDVHYPGTYLAGGYNRRTTRIAGREVENEDLVNLPNWLRVEFRVPGGDWFRLREVRLLDYLLELNIKHGILKQSLCFEDAKGRRTRVGSERLVSMRHKHLAAMRNTWQAENWSGQLEVRSFLDGDVTNSGVKRYENLNNDHLETVERTSFCPHCLFLKTRTNQSLVDISLAARHLVSSRGRALPSKPEFRKEGGTVGLIYRLELGAGEPVTLEKTVALFTSRDRTISESGLEAREAVQKAPAYDELISDQELAWTLLWDRFEISFDLKNEHDDHWACMALRLYIFHLLQTASMHTMDLDIGVPARGWHGEAYRGHIFWDELFIFPLFNLRMPEITRSLLMYRYRRLDRARLAAKEAGFSGAMYPWQSGSNGREESQVLHLNPKSGRWIPDNSRLQRHVNVAIAYNIYQYYQFTGDMEFLSFYGAEMFLEISRFLSSITTYSPNLDRFEILGVMGPDEYHDRNPHTDQPGLHNNAYTNLMTVWVLRTALEILDLLPEDCRRELSTQLNLGSEELDRWRAITRKMRLVFHDQGIISQFEGYGDLQEFDWEGYREKYGDIQRLDRILEAEKDTPNRYKVSKQADVLMLFYLLSAEELKSIFDDLGYDFKYQTIPDNIDYYLKRTSHGSTLSRVVHSWVLARSDRRRSWELFTRALESDIRDIQGGTTPEGIHLGAMAGTVELIQRCYSGIETRGDVLWFNPSLPDELTDLHFDIRFRGHSLAVDISRDILTVSSNRCKEIPALIGFGNEHFELEAGNRLEFKIGGGGEGIGHRA